MYTGPRIDKVGALQGVNKQQKYDRCSYFTAPLLTDSPDITKTLARIKPRSQGMAIGQASSIKTLTSEILNSKVLKSLGRLHRGHSKVLKGLGHLH